MLEFDTFNAIIREAGNGTLCLSALLVAIIFAHYILQNWRSISRSSTTLAALALFILMVGHTLRAGDIWITFMLRPVMPVPVVGVYAEWMAWSWTWFLTASAMITVGKSLIIYVFAPIRWRWTVLALGIPFCLLAPLLLAVEIRP